MTECRTSYDARLPPIRRAKPTLSDAKRTETDMRSLAASAVAASFVAAALVAGSTAIATGLPPTVQLNAGLEASIGVVGRNKDRDQVSVSLQLSNKGNDAVQILLVGPAPFAADNSGTTYEFVNFSGAARCSSIDPYQTGPCIGRPRSDGYTAPLEKWTQIDPGTVSTLTFGLGGNRGTGTELGFAATFAYRVVPDPAADHKIAEDERRRQIRTMSISFPAFAIKDVR